jgi:two-component system response regulator AtoC
MKPELEKNGSVLVVDDDPAVGKVLGALLSQVAIESTHVLSGQEALRALNLHPYDVVVTDVRMPSMDGMQLLSQISGAWPEIPVILMTAHGTVPLAVDAMKAGAADFILKPFDRDEILFSVRKALESARRLGPPSSLLTKSILSASPAMEEVEELVRRAAAGSATVLLRGETGTGKEMAARAIHELSRRHHKPLIKFQCSALPEGLLESELFGYEKGAFTGAVTRKPGRVELAQGGTLFLDEIGDLTPAVQVKLLRLLQDREFERLGGTLTLKADVRFIAATHRELESMVAKGEFREDLFYRLNVVPIVLPPLRSRPEDIEPLTRHFCSVFAAANGKMKVALDDSAVAVLRAQPWPGNIRELQNLLERLVVLSDAEILRAPDVERELRRTSPLQTPVSPQTAGPSADPARLDQRMSDAERTALKDALQRAGGNRTVAARLLGVSRRTLYNKLSTHGLM